MYKLSLRKIDGTGIVLHGPEPVEPVRGARIEAGPRPAGTNLVEEEIFIDLKGSTIRAWLYQLEKWLALARGRDEEIFLQIQAASREDPLTSRVLDGRIELLGHGTSDRMHGFQGLRLFLLRENNWNEPGNMLPLHNANGAGVWNGLAVLNHCDGTAGHQNYVDILPEDLPGSLPAPATLTLDLGPAPQRRLLDVIVAGGTDLRDSQGAFAHVLEGELASPGSAAGQVQVLPSDDCSNGACCQVDWQGDEEARLLTWELDAARLGYAAGRAFRPVLRLNNAPATTTFLRWKLCENSAVLEQTAQTRVEAGSSMAVGPALNLPPVPSSAGSYGPLTLELWGESPDPAGRRLSLDFMQLLPTEQWAMLRAISGCSQAQQLVLDGPHGQVYSCDADGESRSTSHTLVGQPLYLHPGRPNRVYFLFETDAGMPVNDSLRVRIAYGARYATP